MQWCEKHIGFPASVWYSYKYYYICNIAEEAMIVLNHSKCYDKAEIYQDLKCVFPSSILVIPGEQWKARRRYLRASYKSSVLKSFISPFYQQSCCLVEQIASMGPEDDIYNFFNRHAIINFLLTSTGLHKHEIDADITRFGDLAYSILFEVLKLISNPFMPASLWRRIPSSKKFRNASKEMRQILKRIYLRGKAQHSDLSEWDETPAEASLIQLLLSEDYEKCGGTDAFEDFFLFAVAATDTTGHTLAFCFTLLAMHQDIQQRLFEEVKSVVGDQSIEIDHIPKLKYTEAVISETLRIMPTVPLVGRSCTEDINIGTNAVPNILPKGANVIVNIFSIHRNTMYWKDPLIFNPSRFMPENISDIVPGSYMPFSAGPRNCIGKGIALLLLKITMANVIRSYRITSSHKSIDEFSFESCITMKTQNRLDCRFTPRFQKEI